MMAGIVALMMTLQASAGFVTVVRGQTSAIEAPSRVVARTPPEWQALWTAHAGEQAAPVVDFSTRTVAAVFIGIKPTGGFRVEIVGLRRDGDALVVEYVETAPGPEDIVTQALTAPFHIITIDRFDGRILFVRRPAPAAGR